jgi:hypothetical protein
MICCEIRKLLFLFGIRRNCLRSGRSWLLYLCTRGEIKHTVVIIGASLLPTMYVQNFIQHPALKVNSICRGNYWGSKMWTLTQQVEYWEFEQVKII